MTNFRVESKTLLSIIQKDGPITKNKLQEMTGYKLTSLNRHFKPLLDANIVQISGKNDSGGGRPSVLFDINKNDFGIIGIDISRTYCTIVLVNLKMEPIFSKTYFIDSNTIVNDIIYWIIGQINKIINGDEIEVLGIGIGTVGPVNKETGIYISPENFPNSDFPKTNFYKIIKEKFDLPTVINSGSATALSFEYLFGKAKEFENTAYINCGVSIRDSVLIRGKPISEGVAHENKLGKMIVNFEQFDSGPFEIKYTDDYASLNGISKNINLDINDYQEILKLIKNRDSKTCRVADFGAKILGLGLANYVLMYDLDYVIISGPLALQNSGYFEKVVETTKDYIRNGSSKTIEFSRGGSNDRLSMAIGGACHLFETDILSM